MSNSPYENSLYAVQTAFGDDEQLCARIVAAMPQQQPVFARLFEDISRYVLELKDERRTILHRLAEEPPNAKKRKIEADAELVPAQQVRMKAPPSGTFNTVFQCLYYGYLDVEAMQ